MKQIEQVLKDKRIDRLFAYSRKSRDVDNEGLAKHHEIIRDFAQRLGFSGVTFYEEVESSETLNRPMLNQLRKDVESGLVKALVVYRMDRLSRKVTDTERLLKEFAFHELVLIEAHREKVVDYKEILGLKLEAMMSDLYQEQAKMVLQAGKEKSIQLYGNHLGEAPLGYDYNRDTKKIIPNKDRVIIETMFNLYMQGYSTHKTAFKLNQMGFTSKNGNEFTGRTVWKMLQNEKYMGSQIYGKQEWFKDSEGSYKIKDKPREQWLEYEKAHDPIIDPVLFKAVQGKLKGHSIANGARKTTHALTGLVKCGKCGWNMTINPSTTRVRTILRVRQCARTDYTTLNKCGNKGATQDQLLTLLKTHMWIEVRPKAMKVLKQLSHDKEGLLSNMGNSEVKALKKEKNELDRQLTNLFDTVADLGKSDKLLSRIKQVEARLSVLQEKIRDLTDQGDEVHLFWVEEFFKTAEDLLEYPLTFDHKTEEDQNLFLKKWFDHIVLTDGEVTGFEYSDHLKALLEQYQPMVTNVTA